MPHPIPDQWIQEATIHYEVMGHSFSVSIRYTPFGEITSLENHLLELPQEAQQLILGKDWKDILPKINATSNLLRFQLPCLSHTTSVPKELEEVHTQLLETQREWRKTPGWSDQAFIQDPWLQQFYSSKERPSKQLVAALTEVLFDRRRSLMNTSPAFSIEPGGQLLALPLWTSLPLLSDQKSIRQTYQSLRFFPSPQAREGLIPALEKESHKVFRAEILEALRPYQDDEVFHIAMGYYERKEDLHFKELRAVLFLFQSFRSAQTEKILELELIHPHLKVAQAAFKVLKAWGYSSQQIADLLDPYLDQPPTTEQIKIILSQYLHLNDEALCPKSEVVLQLTLDTFRHEKDKTIVKYAAPLIARSFLPSMESMLVDSLQQNISSLKNGVLDLISALANQLKPAYVPSADVITAILDCTKTHSKPTLIRALRALQPLRFPDPSAALWQRLAELLEVEEREIVSRTLSTTNALLPKTEADPCLIRPLRALLDHPFYTAHLANIIQALSYFPDNSLQEQLFAIHQNHKDQHIRITAFQAVLKWRYGQEKLIGPQWESLLFAKKHASNRFFYIEGLFKVQHADKMTWIKRLLRGSDAEIEGQVRHGQSIQRAFESFLQEMKVNQDFNRNQDTLNHPMTPVIKRTFNVHWWNQVYPNAPKELRWELEEVLQQERHFRQQLLHFYPELPIPSWINGKTKPAPSTGKWNLLSQARKLFGE